MKIRRNGWKDERHQKVMGIKVTVKMDNKRDTREERRKEEREMVLIKDGKVYGTK